VTVSWTDDVGKSGDAAENAAGIGKRTSFQVTTLL